MTDGQEWAAPDSGGPPGPGTPGSPERDRHGHEETSGPGTPPGADAPPAEPGAPPPGHGAAPAGYGPPPGQYGMPPAGYGAPPAGYGAPAGYGPPAGYGAPPGPPPAPKPGIIPLRPLRVSELLDGAITYMRRNPRPVIGLSLIVSLGTQAIFAVVSFLGLVQVPRSPADLAGPAPTAEELLAPYVTLIPATFVTFFAILLLSGMLTTVVGRAVLGGSATIGQAWRDVRGRLGSLVATALVTLLLTVAAIALPLVPVVVLAVSDAPVAVSVVAGVLGGLVGIVAAIWIFVSYAFATPVVVLEGTGVLGALTRSYRLIKTAWWRTFGLLLLAQLIAGLIGGAVQTPFTIVGFVILFAGGLDGSNLVLAAYVTVLAIGGIISGTLTYPFAAGVTTLLYVDRRMRREGLDLELQTKTEHAVTDLDTSDLVQLWLPSGAAAGRAGAPGTAPTAGAPGAGAFDAPGPGGPGVPGPPGTPDPGAQQPPEAQWGPR